MPVVPTVDAPTQSLSGGPLNITPPPEAFGANVAADALGKLGGVAEHTSDMLAQHAEQFQAINNKAESDKGFTTFIPASAALWEDYKSHNQGDLAAANLPEFFSKLDTLRGDIGGQMSNPMAKAMYDAQSRQEFRSLTNQGATYAAAQTQKFALDQHVAVQKSYIDLIANDPTSYGRNKDALVLNQALWDHTHGVSEDVGHRNVQDILGKAVGDVTGILANQGKPEEAAAFFASHRGDMGGDAQRQVEAALRPLMQANTIRTVADEAVQRAAGDASVGGPRNLRNNNPGNIEDGAFAKSQPGYTGSDGRFAQFSSPDAGAVAQTTLLKSYVNRGFNTIDKIVGRWAPSSDNNDTNAYAATVAKATGLARDAVIAPNDTAALGAVRAAMEHVEGHGSTGATAPALARTDNIERNAAQTYADIANDPRLHGDPDLIHKAQSAFIANVNQTRAVTNLGESAAKENLVALAQANGARSVEDLVKLPGAADDLRQLSPTAQRTLSNQLTAAGNQWDPAKTARYNELVGMRELNPQAFLATNMAHEDLPQSAVRGLSTDQSKILKKQQTQTATSTNLNRALGNEFVMQGLATAGLKKDTPDYDHFTGALYAELENFADNHPGKKPSDLELGTMAAGVLAKRSVPAGNYFLGMRVGDTTMERRGFDVPDAAQTELTAQFRQHYNREPTAAEVAYFYHKAGAK